MIHDVERILADVRTALDENASVTPFEDENGTITDTATLDMDDIIKSKIADALNTVRMVAPIDKIVAKTHAVGTARNEAGDGVGHVRLPQDYLRFVSFKMSDWALPAVALIPAGSDAYARQFCEWRGLRGTRLKPIASVVTIRGENVLQYFPCGGGDATGELSYIAHVPSDEGATSYDIEDGIYRAVVLKTAELTAATYGNVNAMSVLGAKAGELLGIRTDKD